MRNADLADSKIDRSPPSDLRLLKFLMFWKAECLYFLPILVSSCYNGTIWSLDWYFDYCSLSDRGTDRSLSGMATYSVSESTWCTHGKRWPPCWKHPNHIGNPESNQHWYRYLKPGKLDRLSECQLQSGCEAWYSNRRSKVLWDGNPDALYNSPPSLERRNITVSWPLPSDAKNSAMSTLYNQF